MKIPRIFFRQVLEKRERVWYNDSTINFRSVLFEKVQRNGYCILTEGG